MKVFEVYCDHSMVAKDGEPFVYDRFEDPVEAIEYCQGNHHLSPCYMLNATRFDRPSLYKVRAVDLEEGMQYRAKDRDLESEYCK